MNKQDLEAKKRWAKLRAKVNHLWWHDFSGRVFDDNATMKTQNSFKYMRWLLNKKVLAPIGRDGQLMKVLGIELMSFSGDQVHACVISGTTSDDRFVRLRIQRGTTPWPYNVDYYIGIEEPVWRTLTAKFKAMLLAQELENS
jgi:hypothetical protein